MEISTIKLESKKGGKTDFKDQVTSDLKTAVIVCSDGVFHGKKKDSSGQKIIEKLSKLNMSAAYHKIIPDELELIQDIVKTLSSEEYNLILITGGTGLSPRDVTPDAIRPLLDREIPGIMEAARNYGQQRTPYAMLSRGIAGFIKNTLVITLPGSTRGVEETMDALFPYVLHLFRVAEGMRHS